MPCWHNAIPQEKYPRDIDLICLNSQCNKSQSCMRQDTKQIIEEKESDVNEKGIAVGAPRLPLFRRFIRKSSTKDAMKVANSK